MIFEITRASRDSSKAPCSEAHTDGTLDEWGAKKWLIEINTFEELMDFVDKYGDIVLGKRDIIIYDSYIE